MSAESQSRSEAFEVWWYDYRIKNSLGDHTAKADVAQDAFSAGAKAERASRSESGMPIVADVNLSEAELMNLRPGPIQVVDSQDAKDAARYHQVRRMLLEYRLSRYFHDLPQEPIDEKSFDVAIDEAIKRDRARPERKREESR